MAIFDQKNLKEILERPIDIALLVDFDGTLVDLVPDPDEVRIPGGLINTLETVSRKGGRAFAIITGRTIGKLDRFLGITTAAIGSHGAECRSGHSAEIELLADPFSPATRKCIQALAERHDCIFEDKLYSLSFHLPLERMARDLTSEINAALGREAKNHIVRRVGRTYEILWCNVTKGSGIAHLMKQPEFAGRRPVYIGDDVNTDESLHVVSDMGGMLIPVRHTQYAEANIGENLLETNDVRHIVAALV